LLGGFSRESAGTFSLAGRRGGGEGEGKAKRRTSSDTSGGVDRGTSASRGAFVACVKHMPRAAHS